MLKKVKMYLPFILLPVLGGMLIGFLTRNNMQAYENVAKSNLNPPSIVFPIVWTILYILMGISSAMIYYSNSPLRKSALSVYLLQLGFNFIWSLIFFNLQAYLPAFVWLIALWLLIIVMIASFYRINRKAALLQIPYLLWVTFAGYLNIMVWYLNR